MVTFNNCSNTSKYKLKGDIKGPGLVHYLFIIFLYCFRIASALFQFQYFVYPLNIEYFFFCERQAPLGAYCEPTFSARVCVCVWSEKPRRCIRALKGTCSMGFHICLSVFICFSYAFYMFVLALSRLYMFYICFYMFL